MTDYNEEYFKNRHFEDKHFKEAMKWIEYFDLENKRVVDFGCGLGFYGHALRYLGVDQVWGIEISEYAQKNGYGLMKDRIKDELYDMVSADFVLCYDVLEHIPENDIPRMLAVIDSQLDINKGGKILFSICMKGDPNLEKDPTHVTKKLRAWWEYQIEQAGFKIEKVPDNFWFKEQMIIASK